MKKYLKLHPYMFALSLGLVGAGIYELPCEAWGRLLLGGVFTGFVAAFARLDERI